MHVMVILVRKRSKKARRIFVSKEVPSHLLPIAEDKYLSKPHPPFVYESFSVGDNRSATGRGCCTRLGAHESTVLID